MMLLNLQKKKVCGDWTGNIELIMEKIPKLLTHNYTLKGEKIELRPLKRNDFKKVIRWLTNPDVNCYIFINEENLNLFKKLIRKIFIPLIIKMMYKYWSNKGFCFIIQFEKNPIGIIVAGEIDPINKIYRVPIAIGEKEFWNKGFAKDTINTIIRFIFEELHGTKIIAADIALKNLRSINLFKSYGFKKIDEEKAAIYRRMARSVQKRYSNDYDRFDKDSHDTETVSFELINTNDDKVTRK